jgi:hypothetical protein
MRGRMASMRFRKLRIAWSVGWGLACVLLIVLWVRSGRLEDRFSGNVAARGFRLYSSHGCVVWYTTTMNGAVQNYPWQFNVGSGYWLSESDSRVSTIPRFHNGSPESWLTVPYWAIVSSALFVTTLPWLRWRYSLRTLLIATTLVAVVLGYIVWLRS